MFWKDFLLKLLSLKSPHGGKPPLAPLTDRNKPAVWAATPREAGFYDFSSYKPPLSSGISIATITAEYRYFLVVIDVKPSIPTIS